METFTTRKTDLTEEVRKGPSEGWQATVVFVVKECRATSGRQRKTKKTSCRDTGGAQENKKEQGEGETLYSRCFRPWTLRASGRKGSFADCLGYRVLTFKER